ncbi:MAG: DNA-protecting protein DprA [Planctomyces sp.]|nr:DNA-protecting protein DprA [Planctomyces sp.]
MEDSLLHSLALSLAAGVGPRMQAVLLDEFGSASAVFAQPASVLQQVPGVGGKIARNLTSPELMTQAELMARECRELGVALCPQTASDYPANLKNICDPPVVLYRRGDWLPQDDLSIAIVGSRRCTSYGRRQAERLAGGLARAGFTIVSGLARGIDGAAHRGALAAGGRSIAVLATGVRDIYPPEHAELALELIRQGCLISELPLDQHPKPGLFPQRNRIISGLSLGVIVVEANRNSGALYTARHALEQGREVFAVPGNIDSVASQGCHELIREGVTLIRNADDVLAELGPLSRPSVQSGDVIVHHPRELILNAIEKEILNLIESSPTSVDAILRTTQLDPSRVLATLTVLEMRRLVRRVAGNQYIRFDPELQHC